MSYPVLRCLHVSRVGSSGTASETTLRALLQHCQQDTLWKIKGAEGFGNFWATALDVPQLSTSLRNLNLSYCGLTSLPASIGGLTSLRILRLSHNKITSLPSELGHLAQLEVLTADNNLLTSIPVELRRCAHLKELNLEANRIANLVLDLRSMQHSLQSLQLYGNPLDYLPELSPCSQLRSLSLANVRIMADATYTRWEVEVDALPYMARGHKLSPLFRLTFRRASLQHPLLAGALGRIAEDRASCELIAKEDVAMQQLVLMALSDSPVVVRTACKTLGHLALCGKEVVRRLVVHDVLSAMHQLVTSDSQESQLWGLHALSALACSSDDVSADVMTDSLLQRLQAFIRTGDPSVRQAALICLSSLSYCAANRRALRAAPGLLASIAELAQSQPTPMHAVGLSAYNQRNHSSPGPISLPPRLADAAPLAAQSDTNEEAAADGNSPTQLRISTTRPGGLEDGKHAASVPSSPVSQYVLPPQPHPHSYKRARYTDSMLLGSKGDSRRRGEKGRSSRSSSPLKFGGGQRQPGYLQHDHQQHLGYASEHTRLSALRVLAVLGENEAVRVSLRQPPITGRGIRILALDGGGIKGVVLVQLLRALQSRLPQPMHTYWDLIVGTSTGGIVAASLGLLRMNLDQVEAVYTELGQKVFNAARVSSGGDEAAPSWRDSLYRMYKSSSQTMRAAVYGSKHDPTAFETLLKEICDMPKHGCLTDQMIDAAALAGTPKVALVATLTSMTPAEPFLFRTYEPPPGSDALASHISACKGTSRIDVWQAVRASASAPYYLDDFPLGDDRFQDGATTANNPALIALQQARLLWPNLHVDCLLSLGCGTGPSQRRERSMSAYLEMGSVLIESACSTDRVHEALATTLPLTPRTHYFRFQPIDERCAVELDDVTPSSLAKLQAAARDYAIAHSARFDAVAAVLSAEPDTPRSSVYGGSETDGISEQQQGPRGQQMVGEAEDALSCQGAGPLRLPPRQRGVLLVHAPRNLQLPPSIGQPSVDATTVTTLSTLPQVLRSINLTETCRRAPLHTAPQHRAAGTNSNGHHGYPAASPPSGARRATHDVPFQSPANISHSSDSPAELTSTATSASSPFHAAGGWRGSSPPPAAAVAQPPASPAAPAASQLLQPLEHVAPQACMPVQLPGQLPGQQDPARDASFSFGQSAAACAAGRAAAQHSQQHQRTARLHGAQQRAIQAVQQHHAATQGERDSLHADELPAGAAETDSLAAAGHLPSLSMGVVDVALTGTALGPSPGRPMHSHPQQSPGGAAPAPHAKPLLDASQALQQALQQAPSAELAVSPTSLLSSISNYFLPKGWGGSAASTPHSVVGAAATAAGAGSPGHAAAGDAFKPASGGSSSGQASSPGDAHTVGETTTAAAGENLQAAGAAATAAPHQQAFEPHANPSTTPPEVQVLQHGPPNTGPASPQAALNPHTSHTSASAGTKGSHDSSGSETSAAATQLQQVAGQAQNTLDNPSNSSASAFNSTLTAFMRFPWSSPVTPSSPVVSPSHSLGHLASAGASGPAPPTTTTATAAEQAAVTGSTTSQGHTSGQPPSSAVSNACPTESTNMTLHSEHSSASFKTAPSAAAQQAKTHWQTMDASSHTAASDGKGGPAGKAEQNPPGSPRFLIHPEASPSSPTPIRVASHAATAHARAPVLPVGVSHSTQDGSMYRGAVSSGGVGGCATHQSLQLRLSWPSWEKVTSQGGHMPVKPSAPASARFELPAASASAASSQDALPSAAASGVRSHAVSIGDGGAHMVYASDHATDVDDSSANITPRHSHGQTAATAAAYPATSHAPAGGSRSTVGVGVGAGIPPTTAATAEAGEQLASSHPSSVAVLQGTLQDLSEAGLGAVVLALEPDYDRGGLVTHCANEVVALLEPGPHAAQLVRDLGGDPAAGHTLHDVTAGATVFSVGLATYVRLGLQEVTTPEGSTVRSMLFSVSRPCEWLTPQHLVQHGEAAGAADWSGVLVIATCMVPQVLLDAFEETGVLGVVCCAQPPSSSQQAALPMVLHQVLQRLLSGAPVPEALAAVDAEYKGVCDRLLMCHHTRSLVL